MTFSAYLAFFAFPRTYNKYFFLQLRICLNKIGQRRIHRQKCQRLLCAAKHPRRRNRLHSFDISRVTSRVHKYRYDTPAKGSFVLTLRVLTFRVLHLMIHTRKGRRLFRTDIQTSETDQNIGFVHICRLLCAAKHPRRRNRRHFAF